MVTDNFALDVVEVVYLDQDLAVLAVALWLNWAYPQVVEVTHLVMVADEAWGEEKAPSSCHSRDEIKLELNPEAEHEYRIQQVNPNAR